MDDFLLNYYEEDKLIKKVIKILEKLIAQDRKLISDPGGICFEDSVKERIDDMQEGVKIIKKALTHEDKGKPPANKKPNNLSKEFRRGFSSLSSLAVKGSIESRFRGYPPAKRVDKDSERNQPVASLPMDYQPSPKLASEKEKVLARHKLEGDERPSVVRRVLSGPKEREKKITQTVLPSATKLVKDAPKEVEAERPNQRSHAQATNLGKAAKILVDKVKQDKDSERNQPVASLPVDYQPSPKPASEKAEVDHPSLKDKGRAATEQPNNIFKGVRRDQWGLSSFAPNKGSRPKSFLRTKYKIFNPLKQLVGEHRESLVPDALKELEPAKHPEILVPDAIKRPVRRQKPASDIFSKSFYQPINSDIRLTSYVYPLEEKLRQPKGGGHIGDRKYFPAASTEWKNTIYVFNRNALYKNLPVVWLGKSLSMWVKLSNSGDILKLLIPNNIRKVICG